MMLIITTSTPVEVVREDIDAYFSSDTADNDEIRLLGTDSLVGDPETIIAITAVTGQALACARSIIMRLINRKRSVRLKFGDLEISAESPDDFNAVLEKLKECNSTSGTIESKH